MKSRGFSGIRALVPDVGMRLLWKGYPLTEATWEPESHLTNAPDILEEYLCRVEAQNRGKRHGGGVPSRS